MRIKRIYYRQRALREYLMVVAVLWISGSSVNVHAESENQDRSQQDQITVSPKRCVALHQGQTCYQRAKIKWQTVMTGPYCVFLKGKIDPLECWADANSGTLEYHFKASETQQFELRRKGSDKVVALTELTVAWVYENKKRRRASWRLF